MKCMLDIISQACKGAVPISPAVHTWQHARNFLSRKSKGLSSFLPSDTGLGWYSAHLQERVHYDLYQKHLASGQSFESTHSHFETALLQSICRYNHDALKINIPVNRLLDCD